MQTFSKSLLSPTPPLLPLLSMIRLNDALLAAATARGCASPLQAPLLAFKMEAWPLFQRVMSEHTNSLRRLATGAPAGSASSSAVSGSESLMAGLGGMLRAAAAATANAAGGSAAGVPKEVVRTVSDVLQFHPKNDEIGPLNWRFGHGWSSCLTGLRTLRKTLHQHCPAQR